MVTKLRISLTVQVFTFYLTVQVFEFNDTNINGTREIMPYNTIQTMSVLEKGGGGVGEGRGGLERGEKGRVYANFIFSADCIFSFF